MQLVMSCSAASMLLGHPGSCLKQQCGSGPQVALGRLVHDPRLYEPLTPLKLRHGTEAWPAAAEAMLDILLTSTVQPLLHIKRAT